MSVRASEKQGIIRQKSASTDNGNWLVLLILVQHRQGSQGNQADRTGDLLWQSDGQSFIDGLRLRGEQARKAHHVCEGDTVPITDRSARTKIRTEKSTRNKKTKQTVPFLYGKNSISHPAWVLLVIHI